MIYWLIPYLVAYNASNSANWEHRVEHVFKAEVRSNVTMDNLSQMHSNIDAYVACRPILDSNVIQCRLESASIENLSFDADGLKISSESDDGPEEFGFGGVVFQVEFNEEGVSKLWFPNTKGSYRLNMIRAIIGTINVGIDLSEKKHQSYTSVEKSVIGSCETIFDIGRKIPEEEEKLEEKIEGYRFDVPAFKGRSGDEPIVIDKNRKMDKCAKYTPYFFATSEDSELDKKRGFKSEIHVTSSRSRIYLGRNSFSALTRNTGTLAFSSTRVQLMKTNMKTEETIRLRLVSIRAAKERLPQIGNGAGFVPGIPWPERNESQVKFFM